MFFLPLNTKEAVWMSQDLPNGEYKIWIGSYSDQIVFSLWGQNQLERGKQLKCDSKPPHLFYQAKITEKLRDGYKVLASFEDGSWTDSYDPTATLPPLPEPKTAATPGQMQLRVTVGGDLEDFQLYETNMNGDLYPPWRLDHYKKGSRDTYYQTRFDTAEEAIEVMKTMAAKRTGSPSVYGPSNFRKAFFTSASEPVLVMQPLPPPAYAPIVWFW